MRSKTIDLRSKNALYNVLKKTCRYGLQIHCEAKNDATKLNYTWFSFLSLRYLTKTH